MKTKNSKKIRTVTGVAMLSAIAFGLQFIEFPIPIMPSFIKFDFSDLPELIGAFAYGPFAGVAIALIKNLIHMPLSSSAYIGELSNFILGAVFSFTAGAIYKHKKNKKSAILAAVIGAVTMGVVSIAVNYFVVYPLYYSVLGFPQEAVLSMYQVILPKTKSIIQALCIFNLPFTVVKGLISALICRFIYKPLSPLLHGKEI